MALEISDGSMDAPAILVLGIRQILVEWVVLHDLGWDIQVVVLLLFRTLEDSTLDWDFQVVVRLLVRIQWGNILGCVVQILLPSCCRVVAWLLVRDLDGSIPMVEPEVVVHWLRILGDGCLVVPGGPFP